MNPAEVAQGVVAPVSAGGFSFFELFQQAHIVVKLVMIGLLVSSIWSWAIIFEKLFAFRKARIESDKFEQMFWSGQSLDDLYGGLSRGRSITMAALFVAAMREWKRSVEGNIRALGGIQLRVEKVMDVTISREMERLDRRLLFLATVGSTAPFVGLFGTVWGIMNSFTAIAHQQDTSLATVAPGIAEALFATALGLAAAIPAVMAYNHYAVKFGRAAARANDSIAELAKQISRPIGEPAAKATVEPLRAGKAH
jgi:biopolymer transport protein TolQ